MLGAVNCVRGIWQLALAQQPLVRGDEPKLNDDAYAQFVVACKYSHVVHCHQHCQQHQRNACMMQLQGSLGNALPHGCGANRLHRGPTVPLGRVQIPQRTSLKLQQQYIWHAQHRNLFANLLHARADDENQLTSCQAQHRLSLLCATLILL